MANAIDNAATSVAASEPKFFKQLPYDTTANKVRYWLANGTFQQCQQICFNDRQTKAPDQEFKKCVLDCMQVELMADVL